MIRRGLALVRRLRALFQRDRLDRDLAAELESHLAMHVADNVRAGMTPVEARRQAAIKLGGVAQVEEVYRRRRGLPLVETIARDVRFGLRSYRRTPGLAVVAIVTLGLGIGVNAAIFGVLNALVLQPLPIAAPDRVVMLNRNDAPTHSYPDYRDLRDRNTVLSGLAAYRFAPMNLGGGGTPARLWGYLATGNYFDMLGVRPALGRALEPGDERTPGGHPVVMLSHGCWQRRFAADPDIVGRTVRLNGAPYTIVGVMPPRFHGTERLFTPEVWVPMAMQAQIESGNDWLERRQTHNIFLIGRLADGITQAQAESSLAVLAGELGREHPGTNEGMRIPLSPPGLVGSALRGPVIGFAAALLTVAGLVLLLACANLAGLLLARVADLQIDRAIRLALGATPWDLVRRALVESAIVNAAGAAVALVLASVVARALTAWKPPIDFPLTAVVALDARVAVFAAGLGAVTTLLVGLVPAMQGRRTDVAGALKDDQAVVAFGWRARDLLVGAQVALSLVLLVGSLLIVRSLRQATVMDVGFQPAGAVSLSVDLGLQGYDGQRGRAFAPAIVERLVALPGIESAAVSNSLPLSVDISTHGVFVEGQPEPRASEVRPAIYYQVTPGFFRTIRTPVLAGRDFTDRDTPSSPRVAIVNEAFVAEFLGGGEAVGRRFRSGRSGAWIEIVGVVQTGKYRTLSEAPTAVAFHPLSQWYNPTTTIVARGPLDEGRTLDLVRRTVRESDPDLAAFGDGALSSLLALPLFPMKVAAAVLLGFGALAMVLVSIGTYGLVSYSVARRTREICIRLAIGASSRHIVRMIVGRIAAICLAGAAAGAAVALAGGPVVAPLLLDVGPRDPLVLAAAVGLLGIVIAVAAWLPTRRALGSEPATLLRHR